MVDQLDQVVDLLIGLSREDFRLWSLPYISRKILKELGGRAAEQLFSLELIRRRPCAARKADVLLTHLGLDEIAGKRHPEVLRRPNGSDSVFTFDLAVQGRE